MPRLQKAVLSGVLFIAGVAGEELLYQGLRLLVLQKAINWDASNIRCDGVKLML